jgi:hypothetical protein
MSEREPGCEAKIYGDQTICDRCNLNYDTNDGDPPMCLSQGAAIISRLHIKSEPKPRKRKIVPKRLCCAECSNPVIECYMVNDSVWYDELNLHRDDNIHLACVEKRLNRVLSINDFSQYRNNPVGSFVHKLMEIGSRGK